MTGDLLAIWQGLLSAIGSCLQGTWHVPLHRWPLLLTERVIDAGDEDGTTEFMRKAADVLVDLLEDNDLDLVPSKPAQKAQETETPSGNYSSFGKTNGELKLHIVSEMWRIVYVTFPETNLRRAGERLLSCLMKMEDELVDSNDDARLLWVSLCVKALAVCDVDGMKMFWGFEAGGCEWDWTEDIRNLVWRTSAEKWSEDGCNWEGAAVLLAVPFTCVGIPSV